MRCKDVEELLVGYLYGEISPDERERVDRHISSCSPCQQEWEELRSTVGLLRRWEDEEPQFRHWVLLPEEGRSASRPGRSGPQGRLRLPSAPVLLAAVAAVLLLVLLNTEVSVESGRFSLSLGRPPSQPLSGADRAGPGPDSQRGVPLGIGAAVEDGPYVTQSDYLRNQADLVRLMATLIHDSEDRQMVHILGTFQDYLQAVEVQREADLGLMGLRVDEVERSAQTLLRTVGAGRNRTPGEGQQ